MPQIIPKAVRLLQYPGRYTTRLLQEVEIQTGLRCSKPSEVWLKLTERCNCRCRMCTIWEKNRSAKGELSTKEWKTVLTGLRQWLGKKHIWFTGGEPFLRKDCLDLIRHAAESGLSTGVITNGVLLHPERMQEVIESGLNEYHVSIDSLHPEIHDHLRGLSGTHKRAMDNVLALKKALQKKEATLKIVIKTIIMGYNSVEILPLVDWVQEQGFDEIKFQPLESSLESEDDPLWFERSPYWQAPHHKQVFFQMLESLIDRKKAGAPICNSLVELQHFQMYFKDPAAAYEAAKNHTLSGAQKNICRSGVSWMEILSRGGLRMCRHMPPLGDIRSAASPEQFWKDRLRCWENQETECFAKAGNNQRDSIGPI